MAVLELLRMSQSQFFDVLLPHFQMICPLCSRSDHVVYDYNGVTILACPRADPDKLYCYNLIPMTEENKFSSLAYSIARQAEKEIAEENFRIAVERHKAYIRLPWYNKLFPYRFKLVITRIDNGTSRY